MAIVEGPTDICNLALDAIGQTGISDVENPSTTTEEIMARHYDTVRRQLLSDWVWNFAKKRQLLSRSGSGLFDYADAYALPNDFLRFISVNGFDEVTAERDYDIEGRNLLLNNGGAPTIRARYIRDVTDPQEMSAQFINIFALTLAVRVSYKFTLKKSLLEQLKQELAADLMKAVSVDGQQRPPRRVQRSKYLSARRTMSGGSGYYANANYDAELIEGP